jgi:hypothetical protein
VGVIKKLKKGLGSFETRLYSSVTDEYRQAIALNPTPHIFVGGAMSPTNICGLYSSMMWLRR